MALVDNLRQAIDAEEARLHALPPFPWKLDPDDDEQVLAADDIEVCSAYALSSNQARLTAAHIVAHDPERELRMVAAYRKILDAHPINTHVRPSGQTVYACGCQHDYDCADWWTDTIECRIIPPLAEAYGVEA